MIEKLVLYSALMFAPTTPDLPVHKSFDSFQNVAVANQTEGGMIFRKLLSSFNKGAEAVISLFHQEALIEYPYAVSLGTASSLNYAAYKNYLTQALPDMPNLEFSNIRVRAMDAHSYVAEVHAESLIPATGKLYKQDYVMFFTLRDGKILGYREYWNPMAGMDAFGGKEELQKTFKKQGN